MPSNVIALDCIIVGAGLAGLAAAQALKLAGHRVKIFEKSLQKGEVGAGINVTANATKILRFDFSRARALPCRGYQLFSANTLQLLEIASVEHNYEADFHFLYRPDYHKELKRLATTPTDIGNAATLYTDMKVVDVAPVEGYVVLADGSKHHADLIIGADGIHSITRQHISKDVIPVRTGWNAFRFTIPTEKLMRIQGVIDMYSRKSGWWSVLASDHQGLIWGELQNFVAYYESDEDVGSKGLGQNELLSELLAEFSKFNPIIVSILRIAEDIKPWVLQYQSPLESWSRGQLLLVGDAAHPSVADTIAT
ncbi:FAD binding domain-containing protein [Trichoderma harzianum]|uniref:FAD binding domain-containing protein n=1 Tax=Trichoderma harzianum TaxID=5544 RepID=A0A0F9XJU1_TRIHA|nr:FAD binding domain-containing protein [Trichoderma harzianum]